MDLRDYFAAAAVAGSLGNGSLIRAMSLRAPDIPPAERIAAFAYEIADALLAERVRQ